MPIFDIEGHGGGGSGLTFDEVTYYATSGQTTFSASFVINSVFVDEVLRTTGYTGKGTTEIVFSSGLSALQEVYLKST